MWGPKGAAAVGLGQAHPWSIRRRHRRRGRRCYYHAGERNQGCILRRRSSHSRPPMCVSFSLSNLFFPPTPVTLAPSFNRTTLPTLSSSQAGPSSSSLRRFGKYQPVSWCRPLCPCALPAQRSGPSWTVAEPVRPAAATPPPCILTRITHTSLLILFSFPQRTHDSLHGAQERGAPRVARRGTAHFITRMSSDCFCYRGATYYHGTACVEPVFRLGGYCPRRRRTIFIGPP